MLAGDADTVRVDPDGDALASVPESSDPYDPAEALLGVSATDLALAQALAESIAPEALDLIQERDLESAWIGVQTGRSATAEEVTPLEIQIFEADEAVRGQTPMGASTPAPNLDGFINTTVSELVEGSGKTISSVIRKAGVPHAAGEVFDSLIAAIPQGWGQKLVDAAGKVGRIKEKILALVKTGLDKLSAWLGPKGAETINKGRTWVEGKWDELLTGGIATALLRRVLNAQKVTNDGISRFTNANGEQTSKAKESLEELVQRQGRRLKFIGHIGTGIAVVSTLNFIPTGAQIYVLAGVLAVVVGTTWMCGDALDSPNLRGLPQFIDGVGSRLQVAMQAGSTQ
ncbi:hypothetical protein [Streptomyces sp. NRRL S-448]|uniref:hypothetical protein n=1 Tax=Streptomyces sp. NRRL S-448 TaxID=1463907 RepID=UPI003563B0E5